MTVKGAKHNEGIPKHTQKIVREHRTTIRVFSDEWQTFKETCHQYGLTTCYVLRCFIHQWLDTLRPKSDILKTKIPYGAAGIVRYAHKWNPPKKEGKWQWVYHKPSMTLYRRPASYVFAPESTGVSYATRASPPNYLRGSIANL